MSGVTAAVAVGLSAAGVLVIVACAVLALTTHDLYARLHFLSPMTSLGAPLVTLGLAVSSGWSLTAGQLLLTGALLLVTGPGLEVAIGRTAAQQDGIEPLESPE